MVIYKGKAYLTTGVAIVLSILLIAFSVMRDCMSEDLMACSFSKSLSPFFVIILFPVVFLLCFFIEKAVLWICKR